MFTLERQNEILKHLKEYKSCTVEELANKFFIGQASIRRDLEKLEKKQLIKRTYGGAVLVEGLTEEIPLSVREHNQLNSKREIAKLASQFVNDNDIITIDSSTTSSYMIPEIIKYQNLTVITNGTKTASQLSHHPQITVYCCGGRQRPNSLSLVGDRAESFVGEYFTQKVFFSCRALLDAGPYDTSDEEASLRRCMIKQTQESYLLCDSSKFTEKAFCKICNLDLVDYIITDIKPSQHWIDLCRELNINLVYP